ncbi:MAG TPA: NADH-quinone oxidoreductase subunit NuoH [Candidatus Acidoferrales bacterium]|nr:NADH-quinone oxidoreductase subunit NuoH [Candidatus Acidoferrales bacterium]
MEFVSQHPILVVSVIKIAIALFVVMTALAYLTWFERKVVARIQSRWGPYWVGPHGLLQPLADGIKFLFKEDVLPPAADRITYTLAPFLALALALTTLALIPIGPATISILGQKTQLVIAHSNIALILLFAISSLGIYGVALAGWSSNSKYPLMGGLRSSAQMISYEVSLTLSVVGVLLLAGSFDFYDIVGSQSGHWFHFIPKWQIIPQFFGFICYLTAAIAETNRIPFDLPEAETELVAGFHTEYSSFKFAMFFMAEYANMITVSCLAVLLFLGGWLSPIPESWGSWQLFLPSAALIIGGLALIVGGITSGQFNAKLVFPVLGIVCLGAGGLCALPALMLIIQGPFWFTVKVFLLLFFYVWLRGTLPRFRYDQLMSFGWKFLLPVSLANLVITSIVVMFLGAHA